MTTDMQLIGDYERLQRRAKELDFELLTDSSGFSFRNLHPAYKKKNNVGFARTIGEAMAFFEGWRMGREFLQWENSSDKEEVEGREG